MKKTKKQNNRQVNKVNNQPIKQMTSVGKVVLRTTENEVQQKTVGPEESSVLRISDEYLARFQEVSKKGMQVAQASNDIYQREFALKEAIKKLDELKKSKEELDAFNSEFLREDDQLRDEIIREYGNIQLNTQTGEYTLAN